MKTMMHLGKILLLIVLCWNLPNPASAQITVNCPVFQQDYATGSCTANSKTQTSLIKAYSGGGERGWAKFDVSNIPDSCIINEIKIHYYNSLQNYPYYYITKLSADPVTTAAPNLYATIGLATNASSPNTYFQYTNTAANGWNIRALNAFAINDLHNALPNDWFAVGFYEYEPSSNYFFNLHGWNEVNKPYLEVTYTPLINTNDISMAAILEPTQTSCSDTVDFRIVLQNSGTNNIDSAMVLIYQSNNQQTLLNYSYIPTSTLLPGANDTVSIGYVILSPGYQPFYVQAYHPNGAQDPVPTNNYKFGYVSVLTEPVITQQPVNQTVTAGSNVIFQTLVSPVGQYFTYQWQMSSDSGSTWTSLSYGYPMYYVDSSSLYISNALPYLNGAWFRCQVTGDCGSVTSDPAILTINNSALTLNSVVPSSNTVCQNGMVQLQANVTGGTGNYTYQWESLPPGFSSTLSNPLDSVDQNTTYRVTVSDGDTTVSGFCTVSMVTPMPPVQIINGPSYVCHSSAAVTFSTPAIAGASYYYWNLPSGVTGNSSTNVISLNFSSNVSTVTISVRAVNECGFGLPGSKTITVDPLMVVNAGPDQTINSGGNANLFPTVLGGTSPYVYSWSSGQTTASILVTPLVNTMYTLTVTDALGCTATDQVMVNVLNTAIITSTGNINSCTGTVNIPVHVTNFNQVASVSLGLNIDTTILHYTGYQNVNQGLNSGSLLINPVNSLIQMAWFSITPVTLGTTDLLTLNFVADTGSCLLTWNTGVQGGCQYTNISNQTIPAIFQNGSVYIHSCSGVEGVIHYQNPEATPLANTPVLLKQNGVVVNQTLSDSFGHYSFANLTNGVYTTTAIPSITWGGVNAADALLILKHFVNMVTLSGVSYQAGDVDMSGAINSVDALLVAKRFVGMVNSFSTGDWSVKGTTFTITGNNNVMDSIQVLCTGDVDQSYDPVAKSTPSVNCHSEGEILCKSGETFLLPVTVKDAASVGAISLVLNKIDLGLEILNVKINADFQGVFTRNGDELRYAWYGLNALNLNPGDILFTLECRLDEQTTWTDLVAGRECVITDPSGKILPGVELVYAKPLISESSSLFGQNYPNPFSESTVLPYMLSENSNLKIELFDYSGRLLKNLFDGSQSEGQHSLAIDRKNLSSGVYFVKMTMNNEKGVQISTKALVVE